MPSPHWPTDLTSIYLYLYQIRYRLSSGPHIEPTHLAARAAPTHIGHHDRPLSFALPPRPAKPPALYRLHRRPNQQLPLKRVQVGADQLREGGDVPPLAHRCVAVHLHSHLRELCQVRVRVAPAVGDVSGLCQQLVVGGGCRAEAAGHPPVCVCMYCVCDMDG